MYTAYLTDPVLSAAVVPNANGNYIFVKQMVGPLYISTSYAYQTNNVDIVLTAYFYGTKNGGYWTKSKDSATKVRTITLDPTLYSYSAA